MTHLGDICKINGAEADPVDVIIGGSPCQDLSVAGKRAGLDGERSGLFMEQIRIIKEMRNATNGEYPRYMVWENVPGAFSSNKGEDFRVVLEETAKIVDKTAVIPRPPAKWTNAGAIMGDGWSIAWRVFDAQFWGVPQRRRRIALVADFGGQSAPEILFERESLPGDSAESRAEGQGVARSVEGSVGKAECYGIDAAVMTGGNCTAQGPCYYPDICATLKAAAPHGVCEPQAICFEPGAMSRLGGYVNNDICSTLRADMGDNQPAVVYGISSYESNAMKSSNDVICPTLNTAQGGQRQPCVATYSMQRSDELTESEVASTQAARQYKSATDLVAAVDCRNATENPDINGTLQAKPNGGTSYNLQNTVRVNQSVRRLTPLECERLQGFPDGWTDIPPQSDEDLNFWRTVWHEWNDMNGKKRKSDKQISKWLQSEAADSARYKALGNSIALPSWFFVLGNIHKHGARTLGSLFDGIGGFPKVWQELGGKAVWASEVEPFPILVTKYRFKEDKP